MVVNCIHQPQRTRLQDVYLFPYLLKAFLIDGSFPHRSPPFKMSTKKAPIPHFLLHFNTAIILTFFPREIFNLSIKVFQYESCIYAFVHPDRSV